MNHFLKSGNKIIKYVNLNKAILWKTREISISVPDYNRLVENKEIEQIIFKDRTSGIDLVYDRDKFLIYASPKTMHQEMQFYIGIDYGKKIKKKG